MTVNIKDFLEMCNFGLQIHLVKNGSESARFSSLLLTVTTHAKNVCTHGTCRALRIKAFIKWHVLNDIYAQCLKIPPKTWCSVWWYFLKIILQTYSLGIFTWGLIFCLWNPCTCQNPYMFDRYISLRCSEGTSQKTMHALLFFHSLRLHAWLTCISNKWAKI